MNFRTPELVIENLAALASEVELLRDVRVVVVDNDSRDASLGMIRSAIESQDWDAWGSVIASARNGGYSYGNNLAIRRALEVSDPPEYFLLLNSDARLQPGAIGVLRDFLDVHPEVGIAGSSIRTPDGGLWPFAFRFPNLLGEFEAGLQSPLMSRLLARWTIVVAMPQDEPQPIDWVVGASMMVRRELLESVGLMDEDYFLYFEEADLCLQASRHGWSCSYVPHSVVVHHFGRSTGVSVNAPTAAPLPPSWFESRRRYLVKNHGIAYAAAADLARISGLVVHHGYRVLRGRRDFNPPGLLAGLVRSSTPLNLKRAKSERMKAGSAVRPS